MTAGEGAGIFPSHALSRPRNAGRRPHENEVRTSLLRLVSLTALILPLAFATGTAAPAGPKKPLSYDAYDGWRTIQGTALSRDGQWLVYALVPQDGDGELVVRNLKTDKEFRAARGRQPVVTADGRFVVFTVAPVKADVDKAKKDKKKPEEQPKSGLGVMDLATGRVTTVERVKSFKVPEESGAFVAYLLEPPLKKPDEKKDEAKKEEAKPEAKPEVKPEAKPEPGKEAPKPTSRRKRRRRRIPAPISSSATSPRARRRGSPRSSNTPGTSRAPGSRTGSPPRRPRTTGPSPSRRQRERPSPCSKASATTRT